MEGICRLNIDRITVEALKYGENSSIYIGNKNGDCEDMEFGYIFWTQCCYLEIEIYNSLNLIKVKTFEVVWSKQDSHMIKDENSLIFE